MIAALASLPTLDASAADPVSARRTLRLVDAHHHFFAPGMVQYLKPLLPQMALPGLERSLAELDAGRTDRAVISSPNSDIVRLDRSALIELIRASNDYMLDVTRQHAGRYTLFASLPMPHIDASLAELNRLHGTPGVSGFLLITNYQNKWLGDPTFAPLLDELHRRNAIVFVHPNAADCCRGLVEEVPDSVIEFETDTARTIASLIFSGTAERCPGIRFVFSHAGGTLPALIERFTTAHKLNPRILQNAPKGVMTYLRSFYYDTAQAANPTALGALLQLIPASQVLFGTDFPYRGTQEQIQQLVHMGLDRDTLRAILAGNAARIGLAAA